ncbi:hypothetical protein LSTR_LSTR001202 [Laodelphax striatellus]|uniref:Amino acid transporter transmembrane domain-containing protein n=1 Tax=Laodelphax striatellus TaxID=195883 RepID=A0A482XB19_LAOST|nr:hypothetical protein LSTR_LSTR001202 [Laodelphax striatellus]
MSSSQKKISVPEKNGVKGTASVNIFDSKNLKQPGNGMFKEDNTRSMHLATTDLDALLHVIKSSLGTGLLAMPFAFKHAGIIEGLFATIFVGVLCSHGTHLLVKVSQQMCAVLKKPSLTYSETVEAVFQTSPHQRLKAQSSFVKKIVNTFLFLTYYGSNTAYIVIVAATLKEIAKDDLGYDYSVRWYMLISTVPLLLIGTIRSMKYLVPFSMLANALLLTGIVFIFYYILQDLPPITSRNEFKAISNFPIFFSTVICGLEGIGTILPVENSMRKPQHFLGCPGVLNIAMSVVVSLFTSVGFFGYWKYGDNVRDSITLNLPPGYIGSTVKLLVALAILFTFGLQMTAVMEVVWFSAEKKFSPQNRDIAYYVIRGILVVITVLCAVAVPQLGPVISLVGAVGFSTLGLFIPAAVDLICASDRGINWKSFIVWKNLLMMALSIFALITGSFTSIRTIITQYS